MTDKHLTIIAGPTASGKSKLALEKAVQNNGMIINADSMQVYESLRLLTARPSDEDMTRVPHRLYGIIQNPNQAQSVAAWRELAIQEIESCLKQGQLPIVVGGTGLYLKALIEGLSPVPEPDQKIRDELRDQAKTEEGRQALYQELEKLDPEMAEKLDAGNTQRVVRALEVIKSTGKSLLYWQNQPGEALPYRSHKILIDPNREDAVAKAEKRLRYMFDYGAIEEVKVLLDQDIKPDSPLYKAVGVRELSAYLKGGVSLEEAFNLALIATRQYIKRQQTWFRHQMTFDETISL